MSTTRAVEGVLPLLAMAAALALGLTARSASRSAPRFSLFARLGGWATLAKRYPGRARPAKVSCRFGCATFRGWITLSGLPGS
jgi:hypothetical protein